MRVGSDTFGDPIFQKGLQNPLPLPSFASLAQSAKIELSKWIFYVKNDPNLSEFFFIEE